MNRPFSPRSSPSANSFARVNGKIRAREVRVLGLNNEQLGVFSLQDALNLARTHGVDLVEIVPTATPPVCRVVDYGKYRYEQAKKEKESKKHQHANKVKEIQLSPTIDPHDFGVKLTHAIEFLCEEIKVKVTLRFRGREMAHKEYGFQTVEKFIKDVSAYGHPDTAPKLIGKGINVMLSPLPKNRRGKTAGSPQSGPDQVPAPNNNVSADAAAQGKEGIVPRVLTHSSGQQSQNNFGQNPFAQLDIKTAT